MVGQPGVGVMLVSPSSAVVSMLSLSLPRAGVRVVMVSPGSTVVPMLPLSLPRDVSVELPFVLMHPKPHDHITLPRPQTGEHASQPQRRA